MIVLDSPTSDRMIPQGYAQKENNLKTYSRRTLLTFGALDYIFMSSPCKNQTNNIQTFRTPPDYVTYLVPWDQRFMVCYFVHSEQSLKGLRYLCK